MDLQENYDVMESAPSAPSNQHARTLTPKQKAALVVRLLLTQDVSPGLDRLPLNHQADLARAMASLGPINRKTLSTVVDEFTARLDGLALLTPNKLADALALLEPHLSPLARDGLRAEADMRDQSDPWGRLANMPQDKLAPLLLHESVEVCAIMLSKLGVAKAAAILNELPEERAQMIAYAVSLTATVTPGTVARIGLQLLTQMQSAPEPAFVSTPVDRVGAMLNALSTTARDAMLNGLETRDAAFALEVRRAIFTFDHIPIRVEPGDVARILRKVEPDQLKIALAAGMAVAPLSVEFILENLSKRLAEQLRDEAETMTKPKPEVGDFAMAAVVTAIRDLEESGEIKLVPMMD